MLKMKNYQKMADTNIMNCPNMIAFVSGYHYTLLVLETFLLSLLARYAFRFQDPPYKYNQMGKVPLLFFCVHHLIWHAYQWLPHVALLLLPAH